MKYPQLSWKHFSSLKIHSAQNLVSILSKKRTCGKTVALLNGSFDLLHTGHLYILYEAAQVADMLIVALNSDASVKRHKGNTHPILPLQERMELIAALAYVDYVTWFEENNPCQLIRIIRPDFHVNGAEYGSNCIEASTVKECGGQLHLVKRIPGLATSSIIETIQSMCEGNSSPCT